MVFGMLHDYCLSCMSIRLNGSFHYITCFFCNTRKNDKKCFPCILLICLLQAAHVGSRKDFMLTQKLETETQLTGHRKMDTDRWTQKRKQYLLYHYCHQLDMKMKLKRKGNGHGNPTSPFFVHCHIVWRLQLLDDLHLVGLPLRDAKITKQL